MIRCQKCGFSNQPDAVHCLKCRTSLGEEEAQAPAQQDFKLHSKKTIVIAPNEALPWDQGSNQGNRLREPLIRNRPKPEPQPAAPQAAAPQGATPQGDTQHAGTKTVRRVVPGDRTCHLIALSPEETPLRKIDLRGDNITLDRTMLDAGNNSISRSGHASIYQKDGKWYLENKTALRTTFIQVNGPMQLSDGDVVLLGDSLFKFKLD